MISKPTPKLLPLRQLGGLELDTDPSQRPPNSTIVLEGFDQYVPGSWRKVKGMRELLPYLGQASQQYDSPITAMRTYRRTPGEASIVVGISVNGSLYNLETGAYIAQFPVVNFAWLGVMSGIAEGASNNPGKTINYLISTTAGYLPYKWDGATPPTLIGHAGPSDGVVCTARNIAAGGNPGLQLVTMRGYRFTRWNPTTKHETSPSPDAHTSHVTPNATNPVIEAVRLTLTADDVAANAAAIAAGYTMLRFYATRDGGSTYYLLTGAVADDQAWADVDNTFPMGNLISADADGAVPVLAANTYIDAGGDGWPTIPPVTIPPTPTPLMMPTHDAQLVQPAPLPGENDPPPCAIWGGIYQNRLWFVDAEHPSEVRFSKIGEFESFPVDNHFTFGADNHDPITAVDGQQDKLIIGKRLSTTVITGTDFTDFVVMPLDPQVGMVGRRAVAHPEGGMIFLARQGLMAWSSGLPTLYGRAVRPLTDHIAESAMLELTTATVDSRQGIVLMTLCHEQGFYQLILMDLRNGTLPFSTLDLPAKPWALEEIELSDGHVAVLIAMDDLKVYKLWEGQTRIDGLPVSSTIQTQALPTDDILSRKVFRRLKSTVDDTAGFVYSYSVDGGPWRSPCLPLRRNNYLGGVSVGVAVGVSVGVGVGVGGGVGV